MDDDDVIGDFGRIDLVFIYALRLLWLFDDGKIEFGLILVLVPIPISASLFYYQVEIKDNFL